MNKMWKTAGVGASILLVLIPASLILANQPISFESLESKTQTGAPIFNQVKFVPGWKRDVWLMRQSQHGYDPDLSKWDRLAIVVDKTQRPYRADFYQFTPGRKLVLAEPAEAAPYKARCYACHANGPRAIRPEFSSLKLRPGIMDRFAFAAMNLRVETYGRVLSFPGQNFPGGAPFRSSMPIFSRPLDMKTCLKCHSEHGIRRPLKLEHIGTARFLVNRGLMPPFPFRASPEEIERLNQLAR
jgi:hypothetical protein